MNIQRLFFIVFCISFAGLSFGQTEPTPVYLKFSADKIYLLENDNVEIVADLYIGTWENPIQNLYAATLDLVFPNDIILSQETSFRYNTPSFFGNSDVVSVSNKSPLALKEGILNVTLNRTDGKSANGFGKVGEVTFVIMTDIIGSRNVDEIPFTVKAEHIKLADVNGNELPHETDADGATIIIVNDILAREGRAQRSRQVEVFPNPAGDQLFIQLRNVRAERWEIFNAAGQRTARDQVRGEQVRINTKNFHPGLYTVHVHTEDGVITRRVLLQ